MKVEFDDVLAVIDEQIITAEVVERLHIERRDWTEAGREQAALIALRRVRHDIVRECKPAVIEDHRPSPNPLDGIPF